MLPAPSPTRVPALIFRLGFAVAAVLAACTHEPSAPAPAAESSHSRLAQHIERLLDDPSSLPSAVTPAQPEATDAGAPAPEPDGAGALDLAAVPTAVAIAALAPTAAPAPPQIPEPIVPVAVHPKKTATDGVEPTTKLDAKARKAQAREERKAAAAERQKQAREKVAHKAQAKAEAKARAAAKRLAAKAAAKERKAQAKAHGQGKGDANETPRADPKTEPKAARVDPKAEAKAAKAAAKAEAKAAKVEANKQAKAERAKAAKPEPEQAQTAPAEGEDATELYYRGKGKLDGGDLRGAIADLGASQRARSSPRTLTLLGRAYFDAGDLGAAAKALKQAGAHDEAQLVLATLYQQTGKTPLARKVYEAFLKAHPEHPKAAWVRNLIQSL